MKKICYFLLVLLFLTEAAYASEQPFDISISVHSSESETEFHAGLLFQDDEILLVSDFFPSYAVSVPVSGSIHPDDLNEIFSAFCDWFGQDLSVILPELFSGFNPETSVSWYSGDLFDEARTMESGTVSFSDLLSALSLLAESPENPGRSFSLNPPDETAAFTGETDLSGMMIGYRIFDSGKYVTLNGNVEDRTVFTASVDSSDPGHTVILLGNAEQGHNYYRVLDEKYVSDHELQFHFLFLADPAKAGYRTALLSQPLLSEEWTLQLSENRDEILFSGSIYPGNNLTTARISGRFSSSDDLLFFAEIRFMNSSGSSLSVSVSRTGLQPFDSQKKKISLQDLSDPEAITMMTEEAGPQFFTFYMNLLQILPEEYFEFVMNLY